MIQKHTVLITEWEGAYLENDPGCQPVCSGFVCEPVTVDALTPHRAAEQKLNRKVKGKLGQSSGVPTQDVSSCKPGILSCLALLHTVSNVLQTSGRSRRLLQIPFNGGNRFRIGLL